MTFTAARDRLALLAECLVGRPFHIRALADGAADPDALPPVGDGTEMLFPAPAGDGGAEWEVHRARLVRQAARFMFGAFDFDLGVAARRGLVTLPEDDATTVFDPSTDLEVWYRAAAGRAALPLPAEEVALLFEIVDMARTDHAAMRRFPGSRPAVERVRASGSAAVIGGSSRPGAFRAVHLWALGAVADVEIEAAYALPAGTLDEFCTGNRDVYASVELVGRMLQAMAVAAVRVGMIMIQAPTDAVADVAPDARDLRLRTNGQDEPGIADVQRRIRLEKLEVMAASEPSRAGGIGFTANQISGEAQVTRSEGGSGEGSILPGGARVDPGRRSRDDVRRRMHGDRAALRQMFGSVGRAGRSWFYPEWDSVEGTYRPDWCQVFEIGAEPADLGELMAMLRQSAHTRREVRSALGQIRPETRVALARQPEGDEFDLDALIDARIDLLAGITPDERVYRRRVRARRDVAAAFLIDLSASTDDAVPDPAAPVAAGAATEDDDEWNPRPPAPPSRRVIDVERESALLMADALDALGDSCAVYGFSGYGRDDVEFHVVKGFREPMGLPVMARFAGMQPRRSTRMGPAIRHAIRKLAGEDSSLRILMLVSDGFPQDHDYGPVRGDSEYAIADTARALKEAEAAGIETFCITIDQAGHDYLRRMCAPDRYLVIDDVARLSTEVARVYRELRHRRR